MFNKNFHSPTFLSPEEFMNEAKKESDENCIINLDTPTTMFGQNNILSNDETYNRIKQEIHPSKGCEPPNKISEGCRKMAEGILNEFFNQGVSLPDMLEVLTQVSLQLEMYAEERHQQNTKVYETSKRELEMLKAKLNRNVKG